MKIEIELTEEDQRDIFQTLSSSNDYTGIISDKLLQKIENAFDENTNENSQKERFKASYYFGLEFRHSEMKKLLIAKELQMIEILSDNRINIHYQIRGLHYDQELTDTDNNIRPARIY